MDRFELYNVQTLENLLVGNIWMMLQVKHKSGVEPASSDRLLDNLDIPAVAGSTDQVVD